MPLTNAGREALEALTCDSADADVIRNLVSLCSTPIYEGLLSDDELEVLPSLIRSGVLRRTYAGPGGFLGLAQIEVVS